MVCKDNAYCTVDGAVIGIHVCTVKELVDCGQGGCGGSCLLGADFTEGHQQFVVYRSCVIEEGPDDFLYAADSEFIKRRAGIRIITILGFGAVVDGIAFLRVELGIGRQFMD